jgi:hypothetical protein
MHIDPAAMMGKALIAYTKSYWAASKSSEVAL